MAEQDPGLEIVRAACPHDCPDTCAMLVTVRREEDIYYYEPDAE